VGVVGVAPEQIEPSRNLTLDSKRLMASGRSCPRGRFSFQFDQPSGGLRAVPRDAVAAEACAGAEVRIATEAVQTPVVETT